MSILFCGIALIYLYNLMKNLYYYIRIRVIISHYIKFLEGKTDGLKSKYLYEAKMLIKLADTTKYLNYHGIYIDIYKDYSEDRFIPQITATLCAVRDCFLYRTTGMLNPILIIQKTTDTFRRSLCDKQTPAVNRIFSFLSSGIVLYFLGLYSNEIKALITKLFLFVSELLNF